MATREDVLIKFGGDAKGVNATLASIRTSVSGLSSMFASLGVGVGVGAIASAFKDTLSWADDLVETADRVGLTTEAVQALRLEAELYGVTTEEVDSALTKFSVNLGKARQGVGDLYKVMKQYSQSLSGTDTEVIERYIRLLQNASNAAEQNRIAVAGFGKAGAKMAQAIANSNIPLDQMVAKFQKLGLVMEDVSARKAADVADKFDRIMQQMGMAVKQFFVDALSEPIDPKTGTEIKNLENDIARLKKEIEEWRQPSGVNWIGNLFKGFGQGNGLTSLKSYTTLVNALETALAKLAKLKETEPKTKKKTVDGEEIPDPGDPSKGFTTYTDGLVTARQDAATKTKSITQQQFTYESEILNQYNQEVLALRNGQTEAAEAAQVAQESAFRKLADISKGGYALQYYQDLVGKDSEGVIEQKVKVVIDKTEIDGIPTYFEQMKPKVKVYPEIQWGGTVPGPSADVVLPAGQGITKEVDQTGANP